MARRVSRRGGPCRVLAITHAHQFGERAFRNGIRLPPHSAGSAGVVGVWYASQHHRIGGPCGIQSDIGALMGAELPGETLAPSQWLAINVIVAASVGASVTCLGLKELQGCGL